MDGHAIFANHCGFTEPHPSSPEATIATVGRGGEYLIKSGLKVNDQMVAHATKFLFVRLKNHVTSHQLAYPGWFPAIFQLPMYTRRHDSTLFKSRGILVLM